MINLPLSQECEFDGLCNSLIRDVVIMGLLDNKLRERLLKEPNLTLENAIKYGKAGEETKQHARALQRQFESEKRSIDALKLNPKKLDYSILHSQISSRIASSARGLIVEEAALLTEENVKVTMKLVTSPHAAVEILWM